MPGSKVTDFTVVHISTTHEGGAGIAARSLNQGLCNVGVDSYFLSLKRNGYVTKFHELEVQRSIPRRALSALTSRMNIRLSNRTFFSLFNVNGLSVRKILKNFDKEKTILHLHNWYNLVSQKNIYKLANSGYKVVVTLHDQRTLTGGCHYSLGCVGYQSTCRNCPELRGIYKFIPSANLRRAARENGKLVSTINFIAPSNWLVEIARKSPLVNPEKIFYLPNLLMPKQPILDSKDEHFSTLVIGVATSPESKGRDTSAKNYIKGGDVIRDLQNMLEGAKLLFMSDCLKAGESKEYFWGRIDYLLVPSRQDNSPNVIHEAKMAGVPVIASSVGGIPELLTPGVDHLFDVSVLEASYIANLIRDLPKTTTNHSFRKTVSESYALEHQGLSKKYVDFYQNLVTEKLP